MKVQVRYRVDAHAYDRALGACAPECAACAQESVVYPSEDQALAAVPAAERRLEGGEQAGPVSPPRRFEVVVSSLF